MITVYLEYRYGQAETSEILQELFVKKRAILSFFIVRFLGNFFQVAHLKT